MTRIRKLGRWVWWECCPAWLVISVAAAWTGGDASLAGGLALVVALDVFEWWTLRRVKKLPGPGERKFEFPNGITVQVAGRKGAPPTLIANLALEWGPPVEVER